MCACNTGTVTKKELIDYINRPKNGLVKTYNKAGLSIKVNYKPSELLVLQELEATTNYDKSTLEKLEGKYNRYYYFNIAMAVNNNDLMNQSSTEALKLLAFSMEKNVQLITSNNDTILPTDYIAPNMYGITKNTSFLFAFDNKKIIERNPEHLTVSIRDALANKQELKFEFKNNDLTTIPTLRFNK